MKETFIIRVAGAGQYEVPRDASLLAELNAIDNRIVALLRDSEVELQRLLGQMADLVRKRGRPLEEALMESDLVLPPEDLTLHEATELVTEEGFIPG
ncbi:MAG TPA: hypothetical protein G4O02_12205 [Caldilineae bacterium]|nr:hypothetical protein [Caldilineae bacterium]